jgi:hypothetical protein
VANFTDRLKIILDWEGQKAETGIRSFGKSVREADGFSNKFKAGAGSVGETLKANVGAVAVTAGAALVAFGVKAVGAFTDTAKAAIDLGKATGFSTEEASRWIAVGQDYGVTADSIASAVGRIDKTLDSGKWADYGIATRDAAGNARAANDVFLDTLDLLSSTPNATERARIAADLLGKGWQSIAPILGKSRAEYEKMLGSVEDGQVITSKEAAKAEKWRLAQDKLADAFGEFTLAVGESVAELAPFIDVMADAIEKGKELSDVLTPGAGLVKFASAASDAKAEVQSIVPAARESGDAIKYMVEQGYTIEGATRAIEDYDAEQIEAAANAVTLGEKVAEGASAAIIASQNHRDAVAEVDAKYDDLDGSVDSTRQSLMELQSYLDGLDDEEAALNLAGQFDAVRDAAAEAEEAIVSGSDDAAGALRNEAGEVITLKKDIAAYMDQVLELPPERTTEILALIDEGDLAEAERRLAVLARARFSPVVPVVGQTVSTRSAEGSHGVPAGLGLVGEHGPELVAMRGGERVFTAHETAGLMGGGGTVHITQYIQPTFGMDDVQMERAIYDASVRAVKDGQRR